MLTKHDGVTEFTNDYLRKDYTMRESVILRQESKKNKSRKKPKSAFKDYKNETENAKIKNSEDFELVSYEENITRE